ncbi:MAG: VCBS repeat-containing protein [Myxococcaceae bacterium]
MFPRAVVLATCVVFSACQCTNEVVVKRPDGGSDGGAMTGGGTGGGGGSDAGSCVDGEPCGDGGVCAGGSCCAGDSACGASCCGATEICSFQRCVQPGAACRDSSDCPSMQFCDLSRAQPAVLDAGMCVTAPTAGQCVSEPPVCPPDAGMNAGRTCVEPCRFVRAAGQLNPVVRYAWGDATAAGTPDDVMMAPIVAQLTDDDCDGRITAQDRPEIVVVSFANGAYTAVGIVHALTVRDGQLVERWARPGVINAMSQLASGNIDGRPGNEVVGCGPSTVVALNGADGTVLWTTPANGCSSISLADLDGDGAVEIVTESQILEGRTGTVIRPLPFGANNTVADLDNNGQQDIVSPGKVSRPDGTVLASVTGPAGFVAVGDLNVDGKPEVVTVDSSTHSLSVWTFDPAQPNGSVLVRSGLDINQTLSPSLCPSGSAGNVGGGGPPTIGDFNADGFPDVALAGGVGYAVFDGKKLMDGAVAAAQTLLWIRQTQDCSSAATGSTLFDFDGDGKVEAVYADELNLHVYDSATGADRFTTCNTSGTLIEYPLVADVDDDGQADLIVVANAYAFACPGSGQRVSGVRVFGSMGRDWVVTRKVWNQHPYSVTNIEEDGHVPAHPARNWTVPGLNNFRQNKQPGLEFAAADAVVTMAGACDPSGTTFHVVVSNVGEASMPAGLQVAIIVDPATTPRTLTTLTTSRVLGPTQSQRFSYTTIEDVSAKPVVARIVPGTLRQCRTDNDESSPPIVGCIN